MYHEIKQAIRKVLADAGIVTWSELYVRIQAVRPTESFELYQTADRMWFNGDLERQTTPGGILMLRLPEVP